MVSPADHGERGHLPDGMTPEKLRSVADWLDTYDTIIERVIFTQGGDDVLDGERLIAVRGKEVQADLRRWANYIEKVYFGRQP